MTLSFRWVESALQLSDPPRDVLVADSWLSVDGVTRDLEAHRKRFAKSVPLPPGFWSAVVRELSAHVVGRVFPQVFLDEIGLGLLIRPAPAPRKGTTLYDGGVRDPRRNPTVKGPDLAILAQVRKMATDSGADDVILTDPDGFVLEATTGSIVWHDSGALVMPERQELLLPSITVAWLVRYCDERGIVVRRANITAQELAARTAWFLNSVHGISRIREVQFAS